MKKILVVLTGGTIGSEIDGEVINVSGTSPYRLIALYEEQYGKEKFEVTKPVNVLSENMTPEIWMKLFQAIGQVNYDEYDGIIVTHGSDTLSYTAAFMGMLFHHLPVPVVMVAGNYPLGHPNSNGLVNFANAVAFIRAGVSKGVFVIYRDKTGINQVYLSTRICEADPFLDEFRDFGGVPFGRMEKGQFIAAQSPLLPRLCEIECQCDKELDLPEMFSKEILVIRPYPGMNYSLFDLSSRPAAVLHYLYHSGTACTSAMHEDYNLLSFVKKCRECGIDFYTASHKCTQGEQYASSAALLSAGVVPLLNISLEAAYAKLMLCYNQKSGVRYEKIRENIFFENVNDKKV